MADESEVLDVPKGVTDGEFGWEEDAKILDDGLDESLKKALDDDRAPADAEDDKRAEDKEPEEKKEEEKPEEKPAAKLGPPIFRDIEKQFPDFFKKFPEVRASLANDREYTKLFGSVDTAKEVATEVGSYRALEQALFTGKTPSGKSGAEHLIESMSKTDAKATERFASQIMPALARVNEGLFMKAWLPLVKSLVREAHEYGTRTKNDNLKHSAIHIAAMFLGKPEIPTEEKEEPEKIDPERAKFEQEKAEYAAKQYNDFAVGVYDTAEKFMEKEIGDSIPEDEFSPLIRTKLIDEIHVRANKLVMEDEDHMARMKNLWNKAVANGYRGDWRKDIISAYVRQMRRYIDPIRRKVVAEATGKKVKEEGGKETAKRFIPRGANSSGKSEGQKHDAKFYREHSDLDIIKGA